ncbi:SHOCT domain-containing protein [Calidithermus chliarophilus]|nr:SHOCT domain-containing protein [Calidithermus chliarophilus]
MWLWGLLELAVLGLLVYALVRLIGPKDKPQDRALSVLRERYARGEIDGNTYEQMRRELSE